MQPKIRQRTHPQLMSDIKFACPSCQQHIQCGEAYAGLEIPCPTCQVKMTVPTPVGARAPAPAIAPAPALRIGSAAPPPMAAAPEAAVATGAPTCPSCGNEVSPRAIMCVKCGTNLRTGQKMNIPGARPGARPAMRPPPAPSVWYKTPYPYLGLYMLLLVGTYLMASGNPAMKLTFIGALLLYLVGSHIAVTVCAFKDDGMGKGFLCFCIGIYAVYYVFKVSERPFLKVLYGISCLLGLAAKFGALDRLGTE
jgi:predicted RNA-binding Zn-ribbon protein involved in translation (DUF1610 family)